MTATVGTTDRSSRAAARPAVLGLATCLLVALAASLPAPAAAAAKRSQSALPAFNSCGALLTYARRNLRRTGGDTGVLTRASSIRSQTLSAPPPPPPPRVAGAPPVREAVAGPAPAAAIVEKATPSFSSTNVQEAGVDEPDIVKTDGRRVFAVADGRLNAFDVSTGEPKLVGSLALAALGGRIPSWVGHQLLLRGDRLLVMATSYGVVLNEIDVSDPAAMAVRRTMQLDGVLVDGRLQGGTARIVVASSPEPVARARISQTGVPRYVPRTVLRSRVTGRTFRRSVVPCSNVRHPRSFSGLDLLTVLTIDLDKGLFEVDRDAIMAGAQTVYGSPNALYVASQKYVEKLEEGESTMPRSIRTQIHRFDASKEGETSYSGSGEVTGSVLDQYSLSEHEGALRVASSAEEQRSKKGKLVRDSESFVTVLGTSGPTLTALGRVGGLGKGERIYAVRFIGDKGYVVTFREVDPLYTLDLSDKSAPKVLGELKILGYSAYLHPVSDNLLLGVGRDATAQGTTLGTQLSLFDVSDLRRPLRKAQATLDPGSRTAAEFDPHAFLYWAPEKLAVIPLTVWNTGPPAGFSSVGLPAIPRFSGAIGFQVGASSVGEVGRATHPAKPEYEAYYGSPPIARSFVVDGMLYTLSYAGLGAHRLDTLAPMSFTPFPDP